ncbi:MAG: A/G-specific adenine glycosylase [Acidobacteria bacterium]|nr:MAG: A/G-specific adenine glycosylase [Acidobacteriota bacterium]
MLQQLINWFSENQRPLPWRVSYDPYHVWVSEVMLQQTQVETALPYYERFIREFPSLQDLARADEERVLTLWAGLGYYSRAKNLLAAARIVVKQYGGRIPCDYDVLIQLPGVGQYMAGAILSIGFNRPYPVVDGNIRRVLSRVYGWTEENPKALWDAASRIVHEAEPRLLNQALMELGAKVCSFKSPRCLICPMQSWCVAFRTGMQDKIPPVKKRPATVHVHLFAVVHYERDRYLMKQVDGMWEFPMFSELPAGSFTKIGACRHTITHHRLDVSVVEGEIVDKACEWKNPETVPMSSLTRKILTIYKHGGAVPGTSRLGIPSKSG